MLIYRYLLPVVLLLATSLAKATPVPSISFEGTFDYFSATSTTAATLTIDASLTAFDGLSSSPVLTGSSVNLQASFVADSSNTFVTQGTFGTSGGLWDIIVTDGDNTDLLLASILDLTLIGANGASTSSLTGQVSPAGGILFADFSDPSQFLALQLNLVTPLAEGIFNTNFSGDINGSIVAIRNVAEPSTLALLGLALIGLGIVHVRKRHV